MICDCLFPFCLSSFWASFMPHIKKKNEWVKFVWHIFSEISNVAVCVALLKSLWFMKLNRSLTADEWCRSQERYVCTNRLQSQGESGWMRCSGGKLIIYHCCAAVQGNKIMREPEWGHKAAWYSQVWEVLWKPSMLAISSIQKRHNHWARKTCPTYWD